MIVIKIELWPQGNERAARQIGEVRIVNDCTGDEHHANSNAYIAQEGRYGESFEPWRTVRLARVDRRLSPYRKLLAALFVAFVGERMYPRSAA